jgi:hypothetical protein
MALRRTLTAPRDRRVGTAALLLKMACAGLLAGCLMYAAVFAHVLTLSPMPDAAHVDTRGGG